MRYILVVLMILFASSVAYGKDCRNMDANPGPVTYSGIIQAAALLVEGPNEWVDCFRLILDKPICLSGEFVGSNAEVRAIQLLPPEGKTMPAGRWQVTGSLSTGENHWFCEEVVLDVSSLASMDQGAPTEKISAPQFKEKISAPQFKKGNGLLGYGVPTKQVIDVSAWKHKTKTVLLQSGFNLLRVEFYSNDTYPVFFISGRSLRDNQETQDPEEFSDVVGFAHSMLDANAGWPFELVDQYGIRYKYDRLRGVSGYGFDIQMP